MSALALGLFVMLRAKAPPTAVENAVYSAINDEVKCPGSTLIACEKLGRYARLIELDPAYCDVIVKRWEGC